MITQPDTENIGFDDHLSPIDPTVSLDEETTQGNAITEDHLPPFEYAQTPNFTWGRKSAQEVSIAIDDIYMEIVHWKRNLFKIPSGKQGKSFVAEVACLFQSYADASALEAVALKAAMILPALILQKPFRKSKSKDHISCIERRMVLWREGNLRELFEEGKTIQNRLSHNKNSRDEVDISRKFTERMMTGRLKDAIRLISGENNSKVLPLHSQVDENTTVHDVLLEKHPAGQPLHPITISTPQSAKSHPVIFEEITAAAILNSALHTEGSAGPSGMDAYAWRRMCCSFKGPSIDLCDALAKTARRISSSFVDPDPLRPLTACRLVALDKCPGVRPVGIGEVSRRIISKTILSILRSDVAEVVGTDQLCVGQKSACEAAIHTLDEIFREDSTEGVLLIDASNAFNTLNRKAALANSLNLCPSIATVLINTYRSDPSLFINGQSIISREGTTQGDPLAMTMYALGTLPLIRQLKAKVDIEQVWYADDSAAGGNLMQLRRWWDTLTQLGPAFGYNANPTKSSLVIKEELFVEAEMCFKDTGIQIIPSGKGYLGSTIGDQCFKHTYVKMKVD